MYSMGTMLPKTSRKIGTAALFFVIAAYSTLVAAEPLIRVVTDDISYNVGSTARLRVTPAAPETDIAHLQFFATVFYEGESAPVGRRAALVPPSGSADSAMTLWKIPASARTGRYTVDVEAVDTTSKKSVAHLTSATSFAVHRKLIRIERVELGKTFFSPGDPVSCRVALRNLSDRPLSGLRVEFSERYWPWIARASSDSKVDAFPIVTSLALKPGAALEVRSEKAAVARTVTEAAVQQYAVVVWDSARQNVLDIAFSSLTFIRPPGGSDARTYPLQYIYSKLSEVDTESYRLSSRGSSGIQFDTRRTMFAPGVTASIPLTVSNLVEGIWDGVRIRISLRTQENKELSTSILAENLTIPPHDKPLGQQAAFDLPANGPGVYRAVAEVINKADETLARDELEIAANAMPKSILIFCAHEDDEGAHAGMIRAAVENNIPIHLVYFTSGDSGSCDRYYQHSCSPAEALNFGGIRMEEARAGVGHLGVPRENIHFLGLPDGGSGEIWYRHVDPARPYLSVLLASDHAPYAGLEKPNLPYARRAAVDAAKDFIARLKPEVIYTGHPDERHVDHRTNNWFVVQAMQELLREGKISPSTELRVDQVYGPGPQKAAPYRYEKHILFVTPEARALGQEAGWFYQSQSGNRSQGKIRPPDQLPSEEIHWRILDWAEHAGWNASN
jgi:LmbE family N-acetylglucosaminyl deacetylase